MTPTQHLAPPDQQMALFPLPAATINCHNAASARNAYGSAAQELVYELLGITPIRINGGYAVCFDGILDGTYYEIKSTRQIGGKVVLYDWRMGKEADAGVPLRYVIVCHNIGGQRIDILRELANRNVEIYSIDAALIHEFAGRYQLNHIKRDKQWSKRNGYERAGYRNGYRNVPLKDLASAFCWQVSPIENSLGSGQITLHTYRGPHHV